MPGQARKNDDPDMRHVRLTFTDGKQLEGYILEEIPDKFPIYIAFNQTVKPKFNGFQSHALQGNAEVNVYVPVFRNGSIDDNECGRRSGPRRFP